MKQRVKKLTYIAMLGAISAVLMLLEFQIPFTPTFLKMDLSDVPVLIGGFMLGPIAGMGIASIKIVLNLLFNGTTTMFVGELSNWILTIVFVFSASYIYKQKKCKRSAIQGLLCAAVITSIIAVILNVVWLFPLYARLFQLSLQDMIQMATVMNPLVNNMTTLIIFALVPFNLIKYFLVSYVVLIMYKKLRVYLR